MSYLPIGDYGVIGNTRTCALIGANGSLDWYCYPFVDSPSVFAALLDHERGGRFAIAPAGSGFTTKQHYWPETNVLVTRFLGSDGVGEIEDFMPAGVNVSRADADMVVRRVRVMRGQVEFTMRCHPAFDYARGDHQTELTKTGALFQSAGASLALLTRVPVVRDARGVTATFTLREGEAASFVLRGADASSDCGAPVSEAQVEQLFQSTVLYWRKWLSACTYQGRWREMVYRSALVLKLLTFSPSGAIVAAPTCSLPETLGGTRNWDYRYAWLRDAAFTVYGLLRIGFTEEAACFMDWVQARCAEAHASKSRLQTVYAVDGRRDLSETTLDHLEGYCGSRPVRVGNGAVDQLQLDVYGELLDSVYLYNKYTTPISSEMWTHLRRLVDWVGDNWRQPDRSIWEVRGPERHFVYSKVMCWVALDRGLRLAEKRSFPCDRNAWLSHRDALYEAIMVQGWSQERQAFVQSFGSDRLDASSLILPLVFFTSPTDPRMLTTIDAIKRRPAEGGLMLDGLVYRYDADDAAGEVDGIGGPPEGTFNMCSFWLVEAMTRAGRRDKSRLDEARLLFERMLGYANPLGLYAEETGSGGQALGNYPQAFTHLALISAAFNLDRTLNAK